MLNGGHTNGQMSFFLCNKEAGTTFLGFLYMIISVLTFLFKGNNSKGTVARNWTGDRNDPYRQGVLRDEL